MANQAELGLHRATVEALVKLNRKDPRRQEIEKLAHAASRNAENTVEAPEAIRDLRAETYALLENLREPTAEERVAIKQKGGIFLHVERKSLQQVCDENPDRFGYVNPSRTLMAYDLPQTFEVAVFPDKLRIPRSNNSSQTKQLRLTEDYSQREIEPELPGAKSLMLPAAAITQMDIVFQKTNNGAKLIPDFWARALDTTVEPSVALVGRYRPGGRLGVGDWDAGNGGSGVWALSAVVFVRK